MCDPSDQKPRWLSHKPDPASRWWPGRKSRLPRRSDLVEQLDLWEAPEVLVERQGDLHWLEVLLRGKPRR